MKDQEERELNGELTPAAKPDVVANGEDGANMADTTAEEQEDGPGPGPGPAPGQAGPGPVPAGKESEPCDTAQGALGQVKAKVEVCKDESIGTSCSSSPQPNMPVSVVILSHWLYPTSRQNLKTSASTSKNASTSNKSP